MVRQKNRWILVQFDYEPNILAQCTPDETSGPANKKRKLKKLDSQSSTADEQMQIRQITTTDIFRSLQETLTQNYGIVGSSTTEISVRLYDPKLGLTVIKTSRDKYPIVRTSLMFLTSIKQIKAVATIISVNGSARTARNAAWKEVQQRFFSKKTAIEYNLLIGEKSKNEEKSLDSASTKKMRAAAKRALGELEERMNIINSNC